MLNVLIIGCGNIAGGFDADRPGTSTPFSHAGAYCAHGGFILQACVDPDAERRAAFQKRWEVEYGFDNLEQVLQQDLQFDIISICSPTECHEADLRLALSLAPKLVFCEKPLTSTLAASAAVAQRYSEAEVPLIVNYTRRWDPKVRILSAQLSSGEWGRVRSVSGIYNKGLNNNGSHMLDLLTLLLGPLSVLAAGPAVADMWEDDPSIPAMLLSTQGVPVTLNCGHASDYALFELEIVTERGTVKMENGGLDWQVRRSGPSPTFTGYQTLGESLHQPGGIDQAALSAVSEITSILEGRLSPSCSTNDAVAVQRLCQTIRMQSGSFLGNWNP
jgi:predicted dehydrogenase